MANNRQEGMKRLVGEFVEVLTPIFSDMAADVNRYPSLGEEPHGLGDDWHDLRLTLRKAEKLLAIHNRTARFEEECRDILEIHDRREGNSQRRNKQSSTEVELARLLRKALTGLQR